jgi:hypothetical protein
MAVWSTRLRRAPRSPPGLPGRRELTDPLGADAHKGTGITGGKARGADLCHGIADCSGCRILGSRSTLPLLNGTLNHGTKLSKRGQIRLDYDVEGVFRDLRHKADHLTSHSLHLIEPPGL